MFQIFHSVSVWLIVDLQQLPAVKYQQVHVTKKRLFILFFHERFELKQNVFEHKTFRTNQTFD